MRRPGLGYNVEPVNCDQPTLFHRAKVIDLRRKVVPGFDITRLTLERK
jgi:hypothetical protein